jgi:hypothetical protein
LQLTTTWRDEVQRLLFDLGRAGELPISAERRVDVLIDAALAGEPALACALQSCSSRDAVASSAPVLTQRTSSR